MRDFLLQIYLYICTDAEVNQTFSVTLASSFCMQDSVPLRTAMHKTNCADSLHKQTLILNVLNRITANKKWIASFSTALLLFNPINRGMPATAGIPHFRDQTEIARIEPKIIKINTAELVRLESCVKIPDKIPDSHLQVLYKNSKQYGIPIKIVTKLISVESDWEKDAVSNCGARGYGQIMPGTKRCIARELGEKVRKDPKQDIRYTIIYLREMLDDAHGDMRLALAYYNAGPVKVHKYGIQISRSYTNAIMKCSDE